MKLSAYESGEYTSRYEYKSFEPTRVNHIWDIADPDILILLGEANRSLGEVNALGRLVPDMDFFVSMYVAKEATQSSRIEGTQTSLEEAFLDQDDISPAERDDWAEVQNYIEAINAAINRLSTLPISNRLLRDTHRILMQGVRGERKMPGEFRQSQNWIGVSLRDAIFVPPHHENVPDLMADLEAFIHNQDIQLPHLIKIAIAHYQFETIHPFLDGNGRLGRLLISLYLASFKLLAQPALYLSDYFERHKTAYIDHLMAVREGHHMKEWIIFEVLPHFSTRRQWNAQQLIKDLYSRPVTDGRFVAKLLGSTPNTANALIADFVKYGVLQEVTGQRRNRLYLFKEYIALFSGREER